MPTVTSAPPAAFQSSAAFVANGPTVLEPSAVIDAAAARRVVTSATADGDEGECRRACEQGEKRAMCHAASVLGRLLAPGLAVVKMW